MTTPILLGVYVVDVKDMIRYRDTKYGVCVSVGTGRYLLINTQHRGEYDELMIRASEYEFLNGVDRYLSCRQLFAFHPKKLIAKVGDLSSDDAKKLIAQIGTSRTIAKGDKFRIISELSKQ